MKQIVISSLYLLVLFSISHFIFDPTYLYYELRWLDIPMHILGGFGVASLSAAVYSHLLKENISLWKILIAYSVVAVAWETYEYARDLLAYQAGNGWLDTAKDYLNGVIGSLIAYRFLIKNK